MAIVPCFESFFLDLRREAWLSDHASKAFSLIYIVSDRDRTMLRPIVQCFESFFLDLRAEARLSSRLTKAF
jgi:hypothetical protein